MMDKQLLEKNIISILGIEALPDEKKTELINKVSDLVQQRIVLRILELLPQNERDQFVQALENKDSEAVRGVLSEKSEQLENIIQEEIVGVKRELKDVTDAIQ